MRIIDSQDRVLRKAVKEARFLGTETCDEVFAIAKELFEDLDFIGMRIGKTYGDFVTTFGSDNLSEYMRKRGKRPGSTVLYLVTKQCPSESVSKKKKPRTVPAASPSAPEDTERDSDIESSTTACKDVQRIDPKKVKKTDKIGQGSQAVVFKGTWEGTSVALKVCEFDGTADKAEVMKAITEEASVHYSLRHPNILHLFGLSFTDNSVTLVTELMDTSLAHVMDENVEMTRNVKLDLFCQVARGLTYLHDNNIVHGDIKPLNILLADNNGTAKLCDFGLSRFKCDLKATKVQQGYQGTDMYLAPEMLMKGLKCTKATDVWAFGATLIEVFAGEDFWEVEPNTPSFVVAISRFMNRRKTPHGLAVLQREDEDVYNVASPCVEYTPSFRTTAREAYEHLQQLLSNEEED